MRIQIMARWLVAVALAWAGLAQAAEAQSLGDVARKEGERRKTVKSTGKVYTNDSLRPEPPPSPGSIPATASSGSSASTGPAPSDPAPAAPAAPGKADDGGAKDEAYWQSRLKAAREALGRSEAFAAALESQINALNTDFVNRDDPAQRAGIAGRRDKAMADLERAKKEVAQYNQNIADIQEEGRRAGVPAGWLR